MITDVAEMTAAKLHEKNTLAYYREELEYSREQMLLQMTQAQQKLKEEKLLRAQESNRIASAKESVDEMFRRFF